MATADPTDWMSSEEFVELVKQEILTRPFIMGSILQSRPCTACDGRV